MTSKVCHLGGIECAKCVQNVHNEYLLRPLLIGRFVWNAYTIGMYTKCRKYALLPPHYKPYFRDVSKTRMMCKSVKFSIEMKGFWKWHFRDFKGTKFAHYGFDDNMRIQQYHSPVSTVNMCVNVYTNVHKSVAKVSQKCRHFALKVCDKLHNLTSEGLKRARRSDYETGSKWTKSVLFSAIANIANS